MRNPYTPPTARLENSPQSTQPSGFNRARVLGVRVAFAVGWLVLCGGYTIWYGLNQQFWSLQFIGAIIGSILVVASLGVLIGWRWTRWVIYAFVLLAIGIWLYVVWSATRAGRFPLETVQLSTLALVPGLSVTFASLWSAEVIRRSFRTFPVAA